MYEKAEKTWLILKIVDPIAAVRSVQPGAMGVYLQGWLSFLSCGVHRGDEENILPRLKRFWANLDESIVVTAWERWNLGF